MNHHHRPFPFLDLLINLIKSFPVDYMHNICLKVMRLLLRLWIAGSLKFKLTNNQMQIISQCLINLQQFIH